MGQCLPDVPPSPVDCSAAEDGLEFYPTPIWDFEGKAVALYDYSDHTEDFVNNLVTTGGSVEKGPLDFDPPTTTANRCLGDSEPTGVLHVQGGPFRNWGGGMGRSLKCFNGSPMAIIQSDLEYEEGKPTAWEYYCPEPTSVQSEASCTSSDPLVQSICPRRDIDALAAGTTEDASDQDKYLIGYAIDLSEWDGISFWARRSVNSQPGIRVALADKSTDADISYLQYHITPDATRNCERILECGCPGAKPCVDGLCYDPRYETESDATITCGDQVCDEIYDALQGPDAEFYGKTCHPFTFRGGLTEDHCYDPDNGPFPYEKSQQCEDHWMKPVRLSTEWRLYKVPFTDLLQQGWAKESYSLDLTAITMFRFIWGRGWIDYMIDDVRIYRNKYTKP